MKAVLFLCATMALSVSVLGQKHPIVQSPAAVTNRPPAAVGGFVGKDQFGADFKLATPFAKPLVVTLADQRGATQTDGWVGPLVARFGDRIEFVAVADVSAVPAGMREMIRQKFREKYSRPTLLDWTGETSKRLNAIRRRCNLYIVAPDGRVVAMQSGEADEASIVKIYAVIEALGVRAWLAEPK